MYEKYLERRRECVAERENIMSRFFKETEVSARMDVDFLEFRCKVPGKGQNNQKRSYN